MARTRKTKRRAPVRRRKVSGISGTTIALIGGALVIGYLVTRPKTTALPPSYSYPPGYIPVAAQNPTSTAISAGAGVLNNLFNNIF